MTHRQRIDSLTPAQRELLRERLATVAYDNQASGPARPGGGTLVAHVLLEPGADIDAARIRELLAARLPKAMVPSAIIVATSWPRTPAGKVDVPALQSRNVAAAVPRVFTPASSDAEWTITRIWQDLLGVSRISIDDNFFELGGHSLLLARVRVRLRQAFAVDMPMVDLFRYLTVRRLAQVLTDTSSSEPAGLADQEEIRARARERRAALRARAGGELGETEQDEKQPG